MSRAQRDPRLSEMDRRILKGLLAPNHGANVNLTASESSDEAMVADLGLPLSTVRRRRAVLEKDFLERHYTMNVAEFGFRRVDFMIATQRGLAASIARELLKINAVVRVCHSIGEPTIDLRSEVIIRDNGELIELLEQIKAMDGVRNVVWSEIVKVAGDKGSVPAGIIEIL
ncbi:MAG: hypothetical protein ABSF83_06340 [Nitrososphaerales archaeon]